MLLVVHVCSAELVLLEVLADMADEPVQLLLTAIS